MYDLLEKITYDFVYDGEYEKAYVLTSYSDFYNLLVNFSGAAPLVALDLIKELQRYYRDLPYSEKEEILQRYYDLYLED